LLILCSLIAPLSAIVASEKMPLKTESNKFKIARQKMVSEQICSRGIADKSVLSAMLKVPRHYFIDDSIGDWAYADTAFPIDCNQTISQPYIVALMTSLAELSPRDKVLEIGTGSGYQTAILAEIVKEVYTVEIIANLAKKAEKLLSELGYQNVRFKNDDGHRGWPEYAPYDRIIVTAASQSIPSSLLSQLKENGLMVIPLGTTFQDLVVVTKTANSLKQQRIIPVRFVPMTRKTQSTF